MTNPYIYLLKTAWHFAGKEKKKYILVYFLFVCSNLLYASYPILLGWFIDKIQRNTQDLVQIALSYAGIYLLIKLLEWAFHGPARIWERTLAFEISKNFLAERYHQVLHLPAPWHQDNHSGSVINRIRKAYEALRDFFGRGFQFVYVLGKFISSVIAIVYFSPLFGGIAVCLGIINILIIRTFDKPFVKALEDLNEREHSVSSNLFDSLSNILTVITLRLEKSMESGLLARVQKILKPYKKSILINEWKWFCSEMMIAFIYGMITVGYVYQHVVFGKVFFVGGLVTMLAYINQFTSVFQDIAWQYTDIVQYGTYVQTASIISDAYLENHRPDDLGELPTSWKRIKIKNLNFSYIKRGSPDKLIPDLHKLDLVLERGKKIAIIGESGSGKSTLLSVLRGLYKPDFGLEIDLDGNSIEANLLNQCITLFPQEPEIFENTLSYNITMGIPFSKEEILEACRISQFFEVLQTLPKGLETDIREKGVNLSGGQKQRLALARGILAAKDSQIVLLDEPTSSVDSQTEARIYEGMFQNFKEKVLVSTLHRLYLLPQFDHIYILDKGHLIDAGSFTYLIENSQIFKNLWNHKSDLKEEIF